MKNSAVFSLSLFVGLFLVGLIILKLGYSNSMATNSSPTPVPNIEVCVGHGGVDCTILKQDASVTCKDGTTDELIPFIYAVPQCQSDIESLTQEQSNFMTRSGCFPPSEMGCINDQSYNGLLERLKTLGLEKSELGKNELGECKKQIREYQTQNTDYQACLAENNNPNFSLPGNRLIQPMLKAVFCPIFYGYSTYDHNTDMCFCDEGYLLFNGKCVKVNLICQSKYGSNYYAQSGNCVAQKLPPASSAPFPQKTPEPILTNFNQPKLALRASVSPTRLPPTLLSGPTPSFPGKSVYPSETTDISTGNIIIKIISRIIEIIKRTF